MLIYANWSDDTETLCSSFTLPEPWAEEILTSGFYVKVLEANWY